MATMEVSANRRPLRIASLADGAQSAEAMQKSGINSVGQALETEGMVWRANMIMLPTK